MYNFHNATKCTLEFRWVFVVNIFDFGIDICRMKAKNKKEQHQQYFFFFKLCGFLLSKLSKRKPDMHSNHKMC